MHGILEANVRQLEVRPNVGIHQIWKPHSENEIHIQKELYEIFGCVRFSGRTNYGNGV